MGVVCVKVFPQSSMLRQKLGSVSQYQYFVTLVTLALTQLTHL